MVCVRDAQKVTETNSERNRNRETEGGIFPVSSPLEADGKSNFVFDSLSGRQHKRDSLPQFGPPAEKVHAFSCELVVDFLKMKQFFGKKNTRVARDEAEKLLMKTIMISGTASQG